MNHQEREEAIANMKLAAKTFYHSAVAIHNHPFIEFAGLMEEYIKACEVAHAKGIDFSGCNTHTGQDLPLEDYNVAYINEKLECIFTGRSVMQLSRAEDGKIPGVRFAVSNDGGATGVAWRESIHEAFSYLDRQNVNGGNYSVVAVRQAGYQPKESDAGWLRGTSGKPMDCPDATGMWRQYWNGIPDDYYVWKTEGGRCFAGKPTHNFHSHEGHAGFWITPGDGQWASLTQMPEPLGHQANLHFRLDSLEEMVDEALSAPESGIKDRVSKIKDVILGLKTVPWSPKVNIKVARDDTIPAFGGWTAGSLQYGDPIALLNISACLSNPVNELGEPVSMSIQEKKWLMISTILHEVGHALQEWFVSEFEEERLEQIVDGYEKTQLKNQMDQTAKVFCRARRLNDMTSAALRLMFGEMTAQEVRTVRAVISHILTDDGQDVDLLTDMRLADEFAKKFFWLADNLDIQNTRLAFFRKGEKRPLANRSALCRTVDELAATYAVTDEDGGPEVSDGHDWEGFPGGCDRMQCALGCVPPPAK
jgi:hypothetical protein